MPTFRGEIVDRQILLTTHVARSSGNPHQGADAVPFRALLDTGATITSVSRQIVNILRLAPDSWRPVTGVHGTVTTPTYSINIAVPITEPVAGPDGETKHTFSRGANLEVALLKIQPETFDVLLGMDLLESFHLTIHADQFILSN